MNHFECLAANEMKPINTDYYHVNMIHKHKEKKADNYKWNQLGSLSIDER